MDTERVPIRGLFKGVVIGIGIFLVMAVLTPASYSLQSRAGTFFSLILLSTGFLSLVGSPIIGYTSNRRGECPHCHHIIEKILRDKEAFTCKVCKKDVIFKDKKYEAL
jgi:hypothetical protein